MANQLSLKCGHLFIKDIYQSHLTMVYTANILKSVSETTRMNSVAQS